MKVLFIGSNPKEIGGIEAFGRNLQEILGENIHFYSVYRGDELYKVSNVYESLPKNIYGKIVNKLFLGKIKYLHINRLIEINKYDCILINSPRDLDCLSSKNLKRKIILVQHQTSKRYYESPSFLNKEERVLKNLNKYVDKMIMLSPEDKEDFNKTFQIGLEKMEVIRHMSKLEINTNIKKKNKKLISICRIDNKHKRIDLMIDGMKKVPDFELEIWGDGPHKFELEEKIKKENLKNIKFMGKTSRVKEKLDEASIFLMTSDYEGYPISTIEAIKRGVPLIIRNKFTSASDIIKENGVLLEAKWSSDEFVSAISKIYNNYEKYNREAIKEAEKYNYDIISQKWKKLFKEIERENYVK